MCVGLQSASVLECFSLLAHLNSVVRAAAAPDLQSGVLDPRHMGVHGASDASAAGSQGLGSGHHGWQNDQSTVAAGPMGWQPPSCNPWDYPTLEGTYASLPLTPLDAAASCGPPRYSPSSWTAAGDGLTSSGHAATPHSLHDPRLLGIAPDQWPPVMDGTMGGLFACTFCY